MLVLVTGGSRGIGAALLAAAPDGARRINLARSVSGVDGVEDVSVDLSTRAGLGRAAGVVAEAVAAHAGDRVVLLHSAGALAPIGFAGEVDADDYHDLVVLDSVSGQVLGSAFLAAAADHPASRRELVLLTSGAARSAYPGWSAYGAGKAAGDHWTRIVGVEQAQRGEEQGRAPVTVLSVAPGVVGTSMQAEIRATDEQDFPSVERFRGLQEDGRLLEPADVARRLWELLDDAPATGSVLDLRDRT